MENIENIENIISAVILLVIAVVFVIAALYLMKKAFSKYKSNADNDITKEKKTMMRMLYSVLRFSVLVIAILLVLAGFGVNISAAIAGLGIAGAAAGLAVQDMLKDFIQGINIASGAFFAIGDVIEYNGNIGKVIELTMRNTKIRLIKDGSILTVGNHSLSEVRKLSKVIFINVPLSYRVDLKTARKVMEDIALEISKLESIESSRSLGTNNFSDSSVDYLLEVTCKNIENYLSDRRSALMIVQDKLAEAGLEIPFTQIDIHNKSN